MKKKVNQKGQKYCARSLDSELQILLPSNETERVEFKFECVHCQKFKFILVGKYLILICIYTRLLFTMEERQMVPFSFKCSLITKAKKINLD